MNEASNFVEGVDRAFYFILGIDFLLFIGLTAAMVFFVIKYNRKKHPKAEQVKDKAWVEITWTAIPLIIVIAMFWYGYAAYSPMKKPPKDAMNITVIGKMWDWDFIYENGKESDTLYVPVNKPVKLNLRSVDVLHGIYIPAFRLKEDVVPGQVNFMWFTSSIKDTFEISCSAYCGLRHAYMGSQVIVVDETEFNEWVSKVEIKTGPEELPGFKLIKDNGCLGCHSINGTKLVGPTFKGLFGSSRFIDNGQGEYILKADEEYIRNSIIEPDKDIEKGFKGGLMRSYKDIFDDKEIDLMIEYFKAAAEKQP